MSPKETFQKSPSSKGYQDLMDSAQIQNGLDVALLEFHNQMSLPPDMATAAANEWRRQGAKRFREIFEGLSLSPTQKEKRNRGDENLDHST